MLRQKDVDASWTKKNNETHYGYKNHVNADQFNNLVQSYAVTDIAVHDGQVFEALLDQAMDEEGNKRALDAHRAYRSQEKKEEGNRVWIRKNNAALCYLCIQPKQLAAICGRSSTGAACRKTLVFRQEKLAIKRNCTINVRQRSKI